MSCVNPSHMAVIDLGTSRNALVLKHRIKKDGWSVNIEHHRAYRFLAKSIRGLDSNELFKQNKGSIIEIPCGCCIGCRLDYSKDWATRADFEASQYDYNWFITLTYDDDKLPIGKKGNATLSPDDAHDFIKAVRNYFYQEYKYTGIRFLLAGEYGDAGGRPHLHLILFNCPLPDLTDWFTDADGNKFKKLDRFGKPYLFSDIIFKAWKEKGFITISECSWYTSAYVSQYVIKKQKGEGSKVYNQLGIVPPFLRFSNRPGIGYQYLKDNQDKLAEFPLLYVGRPQKEPLKTGLPRYFRKILINDGLIDYEEHFAKGMEQAEHNRSLLTLMSDVNTQRRLREEKMQSMQDIKERL